jgi:hypothetical protein
MRLCSLVVNADGLYRVYEGYEPKEDEYLIPRNNTFFYDDKGLKPEFWAIKRRVEG